MHYKKLFIFPIISLALFASGCSVALAVAHSENATETTKKEEPAPKKETKAKLVSVKKEKVKSFIEKASERLNRTLERLALTASRIEERIKKFDEKGVDTVGAKAKLAEAKSALETATAVVTNLVNDGEKLLQEKIKPKEMFEKGREMVKIAAESVRSAHAKLVETVTLLKK